MERFDPFAVFGLPRRYEVDLAGIERAYLQRSAALHPDLMGEAGMSGMGSDGVVGEEFEKLGRARQVLEDPEQRAVALWKLWGGVEDKALPPAFLMEMMETREEMDAAKRTGDPAAIGRWEAWANEQRAEYQKRVGGLFSRLAEGDPGNAAVLKQIKLELNAWRYIERLAEQLHG